MIGAKVSPLSRVVQDEVAVAERAPLGVLARQPDRDPLDEQAGERERLGVAPVDPAGVERLRAPVELALQLRIHGEALGHPPQLGVEGAQPLLGDRGHEVRVGGARQPVAAGGSRLAERGFQPLVRVAQPGLLLLEELLRLLLGDDALLRPAAPRTARARSAGAAIRAAISGCV